MSKLNETIITSLPVGKTHYFPGAEVKGAGKAPRGFGVRVTPNGCRSFVLRYSIANRERLLTIGQYPDWTPADALRQAREFRQRIDLGEDPLLKRRQEEAKSKDTVKAVCEEYFARDGKGLRSREEQERTLKRLVYPELGAREVASIKRGEIVRLLNRIEDENGPVMADRTLAYIRRAFNWYAAKGTGAEEFRSPIVRSMARTKGQERARQRILTDNELRAVWKAAEASPSPFGRLVRFILLTAARREEAASMTWAELPDGVWVLPAVRNKTKVDLARPLSSEALAVLPARRGRFVFSTNGITPISGFSKMLSALQATSGTTGWTVHDLRRTARSLMSRAQVPADHAERCLGHMVLGVRRVYEVYEFLPEKLRAYDALAGLVGRILNPIDNVIGIGGFSQGAQATS